MKSSNGADEMISHTHVPVYSSGYTRFCCSDKEAHDLDGLKRPRFITWACCWSSRVGMEAGGKEMLLITVTKRPWQGKQPASSKLPLPVPERVLGSLTPAVQYSGPESDTIISVNTSLAMASSVHSPSSGQDTQFSHASVRQGAKTMWEAASVPAINSIPGTVQMHSVHPLVNSDKR